MNPTHIHLLITHLPIFGTVLGTLVLAYGLWTRSSETKMAAYYLFIIVSIAGCVAYSTGESAEETVEHIGGVSHDRIEEHEEAAYFALVSLIALGVTSVGALVLTVKKPALTRTAALIILLISVFTFSVAARTGYLGGQIRHVEIYPPATDQ